MPRPSTTTALYWLQTDGLEQPPSNILSCSVIYKAGLQAGLIPAEEEELPTDQHDSTRVRDAADGPSQDWAALVHLPQDAGSPHVSQAAELGPPAVKPLTAFSSLLHETGTI